jgi:CspA family cold shock protein
MAFTGTPRLEWVCPATTGLELRSLCLRQDYFPEYARRPALFLSRTGHSIIERERNIPMRVNGTVKFFNTQKGFGFIAPDDGEKDVFVHITAVQQSGLDGLADGDKVSFVVEDDPRGRGKQATDIQKG